MSAAAPYVLLSATLLTAILFAQQSERFAELALYAQLPVSLLGQIEVALVPSVLVFTLPMAVLAGVIIGFARMGSDSEIVAMRAAGVGTWSMLWPVLVLGLMLTGATTYLNLKEAPQAARGLRRAALQGALRKLDSPVDPRTFTTDLPGYVIYVRDGDKVAGVWGRVFIYAAQHDGSTRIVTARSGRIDTTGDKSELVLKDAVGLQTPALENGAKPQYEVSRLDQLRLSIDTGRATILATMQQSRAEPDEMELSDLLRTTANGSVAERRDAARMLHKRLAFSVSPLVFAFLAGSIGLRVRRGGRGIGVLLSLLIMIVYYLIFLFGESMSRAATIPPWAGAWLATAVMLVLSFGFLIVHRNHWSRLFGRWITANRVRGRVASLSQRARKPAGLTYHWPFPSLLDGNLLRTLTGSFLVGLFALVSIFIIFTLFELWRFIAANKVAIALVVKYLVFLLPLVTVEVFPATMLIAVLVTYALLARRSEAIAWWACGQSVYRLMLPGLVFAMAAGAGTWLIQEKLMPTANVRQDSLRAQIKGGAARAITGTGRQWLASADSNRLYSYDYDEQHQILRDLTVYDFDPQGIHVVKITKGTQGQWTANNLMALTRVETLAIHDLEIAREVKDELSLKGIDGPQVFRPTADKPSQLSSQSLSSYLKSAKRRGMDVSSLAVALQRKYSEPFSVLVMAFLGIPLALSFGRRGTIVALCSAVGVSLAYWGIGGGFQQLGNHGLLPAAVAGWAPPIIFAAIGTYFLSRVRT
jgi:LPS export ABC transporter permease LptG/LPS export ABC transporter permease LptF